MADLIFIFNEDHIKLEYNTNEIMKDIFIRFAEKINKDINNLIFKYKGKEVDGSVTFTELANNDERDKIIMIIFAYEKLSENNISSAPTPQIENSDNDKIIEMIKKKSEEEMAQKKINEAIK